MKTPIISRLLLLIVLGCLLAYALVYFVFAVMVPQMSDDAATWFLGALLAIWCWRFFPVVRVLFKRFKI